MEERSRQDEVEIDIKEIITSILQYAGVIIMAAVCAGIVLYTSGKAKVSTIYTSTTKMYILSKNNLDDTLSGSSDTAKSILEDYQALVTSKEILEQVDHKLELNRGPEALAGQIAVSIPEDSKVATITAIDPNPITSMRIANTLRDVMDQYLKTTMDIKLFDIVEPAMVGAPSTVDKAKRNAVLGAFMVACAIMGAIVVRYLIDDTIKTPEEIESKLGLSVLAAIPVGEKQAQQREIKIFGRRIIIKQGKQHSKTKKAKTEPKTEPKTTQKENTKSEGVSNEKD